MSTNEKKHYGVTLLNMQYHRELLKLNYPHDYVMQQMAQTYRTRKAMHTVTNNHS